MSTLLLLALLKADTKEGVKSALDNDPVKGEKKFNILMDVLYKSLSDSLYVPESTTAWADDLMPIQAGTILTVMVDASDANPTEKPTVSIPWSSSSVQMRTKKYVDKLRQEVEACYEVLKKEPYGKI